MSNTLDNKSKGSQDFSNNINTNLFPCPDCGNLVSRQAISCSKCGHVFFVKNKFIAALLAIFLGGLGIHKFYLGKVLQGIIYILFCWTGIPAIIGFIEGIIYLCSSEETFRFKYGK